MHPLRASLAWIALLSVATALLYFHHLGSSPAYLSIEEVSQTVHAFRFASTGRNEDGQRFPLNFPERGSGAVRDALWIYLAAGVLSVAPFSETVVRLPSACAGVLNVVLIFLAARELFGRTRPAAIAAGLLAIMPAHFMQSRTATSQIGTVTFTLAWLLFIARYINGGRRRDLAASTCCLALAFYVYAAAFVIMPIYFLVTLVVIRLHHVEPRSKPAFIAACGGFFLTLVPLALWHLVHPHQLVGLAAYYSAREYNKNLGATGFFGPNAISHLDAWWDCYSPDKLFFSGDGDLRYSTRSAGYFLLAASLPMGIGVYTAGRRLKIETWTLLISGLLLAPLPAALVSNSEIKRWLTFVPFAVLAATCGVEWLLADRRRAMRAATFAVLVTLAIQTRSFFVDYFGPYRARSARKFGGNLPGAIHDVLVVSGPNDCVVLDAGVDYLEAEWDLYTYAFGRRDLVARTQWLRTSAPASKLPPSCAGTTAVARPDDARFADWRATPIHELDGPMAVTVYRRDAS
jgi:4-amino-4-deoxy-L-arabinose transferase-like glycosyltransferase